jgi:hypothetical protein
MYLCLQININRKSVINIVSEMWHRVIWLKVTKELEEPTAFLFTKIMQMEAVSFFKTLRAIYHISLRHIP